MKILCCSVCYGSSSSSSAFWALGVDYFLNIHTETRCADRLGGGITEVERAGRELEDASLHLREIELTARSPHFSLWAKPPARKTTEMGVSIRPTSSVVLPLLAAPPGRR